jgi:hypothetical protein
MFEFSNDADLLATVRKQIKVWGKCGLVVERVEARGILAVGSSGRVDVPDWHLVNDFQRRRIYVEGMPAALPTHATSATVIRVLVSFDGEPLLEERPAEA